MRFEFATASQVIFGPGALNDIGKLAAGLGKRVLVCAGHQGADAERLTALLLSGGLAVELYPVTGEPTVETIQAGCRAARETGCDLLIGFGGGSAIDTAKAVAAMLANPGDVVDYLEVVGRGQSIKHPPAPLIAIPTTAGTGSEVTRNAVIAVPEQRVKVSLRSPLMLAKIALVDPELTYSLSPEKTAGTGMDALCQVIEPYTSHRANPLTDIYCREGIQRGARSLLRAYREGNDPTAREDMAFTSLMGGLALANAGLGAAHGFAGVIGGMYDAPHGAVCAALLPPVVRVNARALQQRAAGNPVLARYTEIANWVTGVRDAGIADLVHWLEELRSLLNIPRLGAYGITAAEAGEIVDKSAIASSMKANPIQLTREELEEILVSSL
jgi:alcohol dehydrogenase class IV